MHYFRVRPIAAFICALVCSGCGGVYPISPNPNYYFTAKQDLIVFATQPRAYAHLPRYNSEDMAFGVGSGKVRGKFALLVRVRAKSPNGVNIATGIRQTGPWELDGWTAVDSTTAARCLVADSDASGIDYHVITWTLGRPVIAHSQMRSRPKQVLGNVSPTIVKADFVCDQPVRPGDHLSIKILFYVEENAGWLPAPYYFQNEIAL